jgi:hypothetical protein
MLSVPDTGDTEELQKSVTTHTERRQNAKESL